VAFLNVNHMPPFDCATWTLNAQRVGMGVPGRGEATTADKAVAFGAENWACRKPV
jgi:hypothetical protein